MLELDDGSQIGQPVAICRYFEALYPQPNLFGRDALEQAVVEMRLQRVCADVEIGTGTSRERAADHESVGRFRTHCPFQRERKRRKR